MCAASLATALQWLTAWPAVAKVLAKVRSEPWGAHPVLLAAVVARAPHKPLGPVTLADLHTSSEAREARRSNERGVPQPNRDRVNDLAEHELACSLRAAAEVAMGRPGRCQRILEAGLQRHLFSATLMSQLAALEASFGTGEAARHTAIAARGLNGGLRLGLCCPGDSTLVGAGAGAGGAGAGRFEATKNTAAADVAYDVVASSVSSGASVHALVLRGDSARASDATPSAPFPTVVGMASGLRTLVLSGHGLSNVPGFVLARPALQQLQELDVSHNRISSLPVEIGKLLSLKRLNVSHNRLVTLPATLTDLADSLAELDADHNRLVDASAAVIVKLHQLKVLGIRANLFTTVPMGLHTSLPRLIGLRIEENPLGGEAARTEAEAMEVEVGPGHAD